MGLNFYDYDSLQPKVTPPNISVGSVHQTTPLAHLKQYSVASRVDSTLMDYNFIWLV